MPAKKLEALVVDELKFLAEDPRIIERVVDNATSEQKGLLGDLSDKQKTLKTTLSKIDSKAKNLLNILGENGNDGQAGYIVKELADLELQGQQLKTEIEKLNFKINGVEK